MDARPGADDDLFIANDKMLNPGDTLDGMGGTDTLKIYGATNTFAGVTLNSIEKVYNYAGTTQDVSKFADVEEYWLAAGSGSVSSTVNLATAVGVEGDHIGANTNLHFIFKEATGKSDAAKLLLQDANVATSAGQTGTGTVTIANIENLTIDAMGDSDIGTLTADKLETLTITGKGSVEATIASVAAGQLKSIDASGNSGGVDLTITKADLATGTSFVGIKGGSGNDSFTFSDVLSKEQFAKVDAGAGTDDVLGFGATVHTFAADQIKAVNAAKGFEVLEIGYVSAAGTTTLSASDFTNISEFLFSGAVTASTGASATASGSVTVNHAVSVTNVENTDMFVFDANQTGGLALAATVADKFGANGGDAARFTAKSGLGDSVDTLNITLNGVELTGGAGAAGGTDGLQGNAGAAVGASDFTHINLVSNVDGEGHGNVLTGGTGASGSGTALAGATLTVKAGATVTITGAADLTMTDGVFVNGLATDTGKVTINAKDFSGVLKVTTGAGADHITGGSGNDTITGGTGTDVLTGGAGADTFIFAKGDSGVTANIDKITDFVKGEDTLKLDGATAVLEGKSDGTAFDVKAAVTGASDLHATVKNGVITLTGADVAKVDTVAELAAVFSAIEDTAAKQDQRVGVLVIGNDTYVIGDLVGTTTYVATDVIQLQGVHDITSVTVTSAGVVDFA